MIWVRKCQECGHKQASKPPTEYSSDAWTETKYRKCRSTSLDYGSKIKDAEAAPAPGQQNKDLK